MLTLAFGILLFSYSLLRAAFWSAPYVFPKKRLKRQSFSLALPLIGAIFLLASVKHFF